MCSYFQIHTSFIIYFINFSLKGFSSLIAVIKHQSNIVRNEMKMTQTHLNILKYIDNVLQQVCLLTLKHNEIVNYSINESFKNIFNLPLTRFSMNYFLKFIMYFNIRTMTIMFMRTMKGSGAYPQLTIEVSEKKFTQNLYHLPDIRLRIFLFVNFI